MKGLLSTGIIMFFLFVIREPLKLLLLNIKDLTIYLILVNYDALEIIYHELCNTMTDLQNIKNNIYNIYCMLHLLILMLVVIQVLRCWRNKYGTFPQSKNSKMQLEVQQQENQEIYGHESQRMPSIEDVPKRKSLRNNRTAVSESVRQNIELIETDLLISGSNLLDELQNYEYLCEQDVNILKLRNREDQAHIFAEKLEVMDDKSFIHVIELLHKCSFDHIADQLKSSYDDNKLALTQPDTQHHGCPICRLKCEVNIKELRSKLKKEELLPYGLYIDINASIDGRGHQDNLWKELFKYFKTLDPVEGVETKFIKMLEQKHRGLCDCFLYNYPTLFKCSCQN